ncbi:amidohydrolase family protein [Bordetella petrii]|uniref:amidohydrolase family protein n=1 Tax=Bordetella petrii TaxID=94624 RepID=UPI001F606E57|nr:amidohydrolase family protein [Bordetella petrii]
MPALPAGACDCHVHVIGDPARYPMAAGRHYTPGPATPQDLRRHMAGLGLQRAVIVQPSVYGTDNRCLLDGLRALDGAGRGVAVLDAAAPAAMLQALHAQGVRGLRINLESAGLSDAQSIRDELDAWGRRLAPLGWHLQVYASLDAIAAAAPALAGLPVPVVLDHFAMIPAGAAPRDPRVQTVLSLVARGAAYVKLSAPYRIDAPGAAPEAVAALAAAFIGSNPERILWASDWPHTNREPGRAAHETSAYRTVGSGRLAQGIGAWLPEAVRARVLVDNPARLYGF